MSDDVEHFYFESCTCHLMSNIAFSVIKISLCTHYANRSTTVQIGFWFSDDPVQRSRWSVSIDTHVRDHMAPRCSTSGGSCRLISYLDQQKQRAEPQSPIVCTAARGRLMFLLPLREKVRMRGDRPSP